MEHDILISRIIEAQRQLPDERALLAGISGIDASGKGFITERLASELRTRGHRVAATNVDGWLNLPNVRFDGADPAGNFYRKALRLDEMFDRLILPLRDRRSVIVEADYTEETASEYRTQEYEFKDIDIILLEGIFLFKLEYADLFDLRIWIECSFETALERAVARSQEGLSAEATIRAYETIYFPAQRLHFKIDEPTNAADMIYTNDDQRK